jgi:hypothetical protein
MSLGDFVIVVVPLPPATVVHDVPGAISLPSFWIVPVNVAGDGVTPPHGVDGLGLEPVNVKPVVPCVPSVCTEGEILPLTVKVTFGQPGGKGTTTEPEMLLPVEVTVQVSE